MTAACCITLIAVTRRNILQTAVTSTSGGLQHEHAASAVKVATNFRGTKYWETVVLPKIRILVQQNHHWWGGPFGYMANEDAKPHPHIGVSAS